MFTSRLATCVALFLVPVQSACAGREKQPAPADVVQQSPNAAASADAAPQPPCGNGKIDTSANEECDDGNDDDTDGCTNACTINLVCGNGVPQTGEQCDDGNNI